MTSFVKSEKFHNIYTFSRNSFFQPRSAYLISGLFGFFFSAGKMFFSQNILARTMFSAKIQQAERGAAGKYIYDAGKISKA